MAWEHLDVNRPHLVYILLGAFTSLFMLCSSVIKERLYIGEATVATIFGIIFGPHCADLINPHTWGNVDQITLEFSRIVLVVQCFAVGVELPKAYMEKHWKSVVFLLVPVMTFGWLVTSLFIWATMYGSLNWLDSLCVAACVTATDPVLASSVVGKGKFAKRVPKHLRDLLSAESGCNDGMAFPFIYLALYLIRYRPDASETSFHWFCFTILYECIFGAVYGVVVGYLARRAIRYAHEMDLIDRESFLVFYFVLALFCAGSGSILGIDDLLVGFACGVGFSNDGWFLEKTEEAHVSNVIDLLINLAFFVYFGTIIPWDLYSSSIIGTSPWRLVVIALLVIFFRRIPIMLALKPVIPDIKTWREALFAGHFGPIGVGALFVAILARAELETESTTPLAKLPPPDFEHANIIELIWPITTFLVITSIIVHGSSIAVFTLGKHINTLTINMSYTQGHEDGYSWMDRLPRIQSRSKSSMAKDDSDEYDEKDEEKGNNFVASLPRNFLRRQKEADTPHIPSRKQGSRKKRWDSGLGPGGPVSLSAISPAPPLPPDGISSPERTDSDTLAVHSEDSPDQSIRKEHSKMSNEDVPDVEVYEEGHNTIIEDEDGSVLAVIDSRGETVQERREHAAHDVKELMAEGKIKRKTNRVEGQRPTEARRRSETEHYNELGGFPEGDTGQMSSMRRKLSAWGFVKEKDAESSEKKSPTRKSGPAHAFKFGRTIIIEDEDGEVIQKYDIPDEKEKKEKRDRKQSVTGEERPTNRLQRVSTWLGLNPEEEEKDDGEPSTAARTADDTDHDDGVRFTLAGDKRRMSKMEFIKQIQSLDPRFRPEAVDEETQASDPARVQTTEGPRKEALKSQGGNDIAQEATESEDGDVPTALTRVETQKDRAAREDDLYLVNSADIPTHPVTRELKKYSIGGETAAQRRRRQAALGEPSIRPPPPAQTRSNRQVTTAQSSLEDGETPAERRRREAALGLSKEESDSDEEESMPRQPVPAQQVPRQGIRFMDQPPTPRSTGKESQSRSRFRRQ